MVIRVKSLLQVLISDLPVAVFVVQVKGHLVARVRELVLVVYFKREVQELLEVHVKSAFLATPHKLKNAHTEELGLLPEQVARIVDYRMVCDHDVLWYSVVCKLHEQLVHAVEEGLLSARLHNVAQAVLLLAARQVTAKRVEGAQMHN